MCLISYYWIIIIDHSSLVARRLFVHSTSTFGSTFCHCYRFINTSDLSVTLNLVYSHHPSMNNFFRFFSLDHCCHLDCHDNDESRCKSTNSSRKYWLFHLDCCRFDGRLSFGIYCFYSLSLEFESKKVFKSKWSQFPSILDVNRIFSSLSMKCSKSFVVVPVNLYTIIFYFSAKSSFDSSFSVSCEAFFRIFVFSSYRSFVLHWAMIILFYSCIRTIEQWNFCNLQFFLLDLSLSLMINVERHWKTIETKTAGANRFCPSSVDLCWNTISFMINLFHSSTVFRLSYTLWFCCHSVFSLFWSISMGIIRKIISIIQSGCARSIYHQQSMELCAQTSDKASKRINPPSTRCIIQWRILIEDSCDTKWMNLMNTWVLTRLQHINSC